MAHNPLTKVARQHENTWTSLQRHVSGMHYEYSSLFPEEVLAFFRNKAISVGSSIGYLAPTLLTTTAFILAKTDATVITGPNHQQLPNIFALFVGYPGTGKSASVDHAATTPVLSITKPDETLLIGRATSSALVKQIANYGNAYVVSLEIFHTLNKLLKSDDETATGNVQLLCKLFSGERATYHYSTEKVREIPSNTPFSILGCTQIQNAAKLIARMDQGHGLIDRFLISIPMVLRPTPQEQHEASAQITTESIETFDEIFQAIQDYHETNLSTVYTFDDDAQSLLQKMNEEFTVEVNMAILDGNMPPKTKKSDHLPRIALALHVLKYATKMLLAGQPIDECPTVIDSETLERANTFVIHLEQQKDAVCQFIQTITQDACEKVREQPSLHSIKSAILSFPGPALTYRAFKQSASPVALRTVTSTEFNAALEKLCLGYGKTVVARVARAPKPTTVFMKNNPASFNPWPADALITFDVYRTKYERPNAISSNIRRMLVLQGDLTENQVGGQD